MSNNNETYKPHWTLRSTKVKRKAKASCVFDTACNVMLVLYLIGLYAWIFFDAFK